MRGIVVLLVVFGVASSKKGQEVLFTSLRCFFLSLWIQIGSLNDTERCIWPNKKLACVKYWGYLTQGHF
ncbi:hypothetical protein AAZX31_05G219400 [Glycine max]